MLHASVEANSSILQQSRGTTRRSNNAEPEDGTDSAGSAMEGDFDDICLRLTENDPELTTIVLGEAGLDELTAVNLGRSLKGNTNVTKMVIDFTHLDKFCGSAFAFLDFIENSAGLTSVELENTDLKNTKVCSILMVLLPAMGKNPNISDFVMRSPNAKYINIFVALWYAIINFIFGRGNTANGQTIALLQSSIALAFSQCQSWENLTVDRLPERFVSQLLPDLNKLQALSTLTLIPDAKYTIKTFEAIAALARETASLESLNLEGFSMIDSKQLWSLAQGLSDSMSVTGLSITASRFNSGATKIFEGLFDFTSDHPNHVSQLKLGKDVRFAKPTGKVLANIADLPCALRDLDLEECSLPTRQLLQFLTAVEGQDECLLERLSLANANADSDAEMLKTVVPNMAHLKEFVIDDCIMTEEQKHELVDSFKCSSSLEKCRLNGRSIRLKELKPTKQFSFKKLDRVASYKRKESFKGVLSSEEIKQIDAADEFLQGKEEDTTTSDWEDMKENDNTREAMMSILNRHSLSSRVLDLLKEEENTVV